jgi:NAD(P)-dependent dehydrogenase (short-subunit alcohol dehydrogenase family)
MTGFELIAVATSPGRGQRVLVTGGATGIRRALCLAMVPRGDTPMTVRRGFSKMSTEEFAAGLLDALAIGRNAVAIGEASRMLFLARWFPALAERPLRPVIRPNAAVTPGSLR